MTESPATELQAAAHFFLNGPSEADAAGLVPPVSWQDYAQAYEDVFYNTRGWNIPLWESVFRGDQARLLDANTLKVRELYELWGLDLAPGCRELPDHIGVEFSFAAFLAQLKDPAVDLVLAEFLNERIVFLLVGIEMSLAGIEGREPAHDAVLKQLRHFRLLAVELCEKIISKKWADEASDVDADETRDADKAYGTNKTRDPDDLLLNTDIDSTEDNTSRDAALALVGDVFVESSQHCQEVDSLRIPVVGQNNCGGRCASTATVYKGALLSLDFDTERTPCATWCKRGSAYPGTFLSARRLRYPMKRIGERGEGRFKRISWEEALETIAREWTRITERYGPESRYFIPGGGVSSVAMPGIFARRLAALDGGFLDSYNAYSSACAEVTTPYLYGTTTTGSSSFYLQESNLIILWGHNPAETLFGSYFMSDLQKARARGTRVISIDPRYSETADALDAEWIAIRPTTDAALADALAYVILSEGLEDRAFIDSSCLGFDAEHMPAGVPAEYNYSSYLFGIADGTPKTPAWAEEITGVDAARIVELARAYATAKPAALIPGLGVQRHSNGEQNVRGCIMLAALTGNVGLVGGSAAGQGFIKGHPLFALPQGTNPYTASIPSFLWTDAITRGPSLTARDDGVRGVERLKAPIKLLFSLASNLLINQHSDINRTIGILRDISLCEFIVVSDVFMTPSARFADILLPAPSFFETANIPYPWREGDFLLYSEKAIEPLFESREDYQWLRELARSLGLYEEFTQGFETSAQWLEHLYSQHASAHPQLPPYAQFVKAGGHYYEEPTRFVAFREQREDFANNPFPTPSGKIEICSERLYALGDKRIPATPRYVPGFEGPEDELRNEHPFQLIGWHTKRRAHSVHDNNPLLEALEQPFVHMNSGDARRLGIEDGASVELYNRRGCVRTVVRASSNIMPGVLALAQGAWYTPDDQGIDTRGSINVLTTSTPTPLAKGNPQHSNLVALRRVG
ncbi:MAG: molybdopterin-dependent oxidoreductase [Coriobacteriales bacterium]|jgi:anaerobic dimethyl sulfoxide reductase subunit A|nr:molybdopterin-dependent oxidoreductase [Coriobacteriales bacterium]